MQQDDEVDPSTTWDDRDESGIRKPAAWLLSDRVDEIWQADHSMQQCRKRLVSHYRMDPGRCGDANNVIELAHGGGVHVSRPGGWSVLAPGGVLAVEPARPAPSHAFRFWTFVRREMGSAR
jgi:hypothetical protein